MTIEMKDGMLTAGGATLFAGLSFRAQEGEVCSVDALPAEAHTPLMHALMGLTGLDEGFVCIDGEALTELSSPWLRRYMAYVPRRLRWPDEERFRGMSDAEVHRLLMENAAAGDAPIVFVEGISGADDEELCQRMAQNGKAVVVCREPSSEPASPTMTYEVREGDIIQHGPVVQEGELFNQEMI